MSEFWKVVKFSLFSFSAGLIQMGSFALLHECTNLGYWPSYLFSLLLSVLWNFTLNRKFTFHSAANIPVAMAKVALYYLIFTPLSTLLGNYLNRTLLWNEYQYGTQFCDGISLSTLLCIPLIQT